MSAFETYWKHQPGYANEYDIARAAWLAALEEAKRQMPTRSELRRTEWDEGWNHAVHAASEHISALIEASKEEASRG